MTVNNQQKILALWSVFLFGTIFHTQLGLMPLFYGESVAMPETSGVNIASQMWLMLGFFLLPLIAIVATTFTNSNRYRVIHFGLTIFYSVMNFLHVVLDLLVTPIAWYQIALMVFLFIVDTLLNLVAFQWMQEYLNRKKPRKELPAHL